jgi:hypothetical protein
MARFVTQIWARVLRAGKLPPERFVRSCRAASWPPASRPLVHRGRDTTPDEGPLMAQRRRSRFTRLARRVVLLSTLAAPLVGAQQPAPSLTGKVTEAGSGQPVPAAQVSVVGTSIGTITTNDGSYTIRGIPPGNVEVRVLRVGYAEQKKPVTISAAGTASLDFTLSAISLQLAPVVTTATGEQRRVEVGNAIAQVDAAKVVDNGPVANINDLLTSRASGVQVLSSGATGTGARVRIRGTNSLSLSNDPVYVVDGVRVEASSTGMRAQ